MVILTTALTALLVLPGCARRVSTTPGSVSLVAHDTHKVVHEVVQEQEEAVKGIHGEIYTLETNIPDSKPHTEVISKHVDTISSGTDKLKEVVVPNLETISVESVKLDSEIERLNQELERERSKANTAIRNTIIAVATTSFVIAMGLFAFALLRGSASAATLGGVALVTSVAATAYQTYLDYIVLAFSVLVLLAVIGGVIIAVYDGRLLKWYRNTTGAEAQVKLISEGHSDAAGALHRISNGDCEESKQMSKRIAKIKTNRLDTGGGR